MSSDEAGPVSLDTWQDLSLHAVSAAIRWNTRKVERWADEEGPTKDAEIGFAMQLLDEAAQGNAQLSLHAPEGWMEFSLGLQVQFDIKPQVDDAVGADFARNVVAPMLVSYLRGAVTSESQIMGWKDLILPPTVERTLQSMSNEQLIDSSDPLE